jgi:ribulose-phosphate 3-epimerase
MIVIEPSILSADLASLGDQVRQVQAAGGSIVQIDIMDGQFVPNLTFGPNVVRALRPQVGLMLDVHLMILQPERFIEEFVQAGADRIIVHRETCPQLVQTLGSIRALGAEAGVTISPDTPAEALGDALELADLVQVMTVYPGFGGQAFLRSMLPKIRRLKEMLAEGGLDTPIAVDGGIDTDTAPLAVAAGASVLIAGSSVFNSKASIAENMAGLMASLAAG